MNLDRLSARVNQADLVIQAQGGAGSLGDDILRRLVTLKSKLSRATTSSEYTELSKQIGRLEHHHKTLLEDAGQEVLFG